MTNQNTHSQRRITQIALVIPAVITVLFNSTSQLAAVYHKTALSIVEKLVGARWLAEILFYNFWPQN